MRNKIILGVILMVSSGWPCRSAQKHPLEYSDDQGNSVTVLNVEMTQSPQKIATGMMLMLEGGKLVPRKASSQMAALGPDSTFLIVDYLINIRIAKFKSDVSKELLCCDIGTSKCVGGIGKMPIEGEDYWSQDFTRNLKTGKTELQLLYSVKNPDTRNLQVRFVNNLYPLFSLDAGARQAADELRLTKLIEDLSGPDVAVRTNVANTLNKMGPKAKSAVPELIKLLSEDNVDDIRKLAAFVLGGIGPDAKSAAPELIKLLSDDNIDEVREFAAYALGQIGPEARSAVPELTKLLSEPGNKLRERAAKALSVIGKSAVAGSAVSTRTASEVQAWLAQLKSSNAQERRKAAFELGGAKAAEAVEPLLELLDDESEKVCGTAALALGRIGDKRALTPLIERLEDESAYVRASAAKALGSLGDKRAMKPLKSALTDDTPQVRKAATEALKRLGAKQ